jgi:hypothetical protein
VDYLQLTLPARENPRPLKLRPREVQTWLDNLPYMDLSRTCRLASHQLRLMNRQVVPPAARLEILGQFLAAYHRLSESVPGTPAGTQQVRPLLKRLCQDLGFGYKIVVHELADTRCRFLEGRNLSAALLGALHVLGLQLLHYYRNYQRAPRALWTECLALYRYARATGRQAFSAPLPGAGKVELDATFRLIALLRLSNPYRLPQGMIMALEHYLRLNVQLGVVETGRPAREGVSRVLISADDQSSGNAAEAPLTLNLAELVKQLKRDIGALKQNRPTRSLGLPASVPADPLLRTLEQLLTDWESAPSRGNERQAAQAKVELVSGIDAAYCVLNRGRCFDRRLFQDPGADNVIDLGHRALPEDRPPAPAPTVSLCLTLNRSRGGVALSHCGDAALCPQVGQLVAVRRATGPASPGWVLAVCRWRAENDSGSGFDIGLQYLARKARSVVIRWPSGSGYPFRPALMADQRRGTQPVISLITQGGDILPGQHIGVYDRGKQHQLRCLERLESGVGFERLLCLPA